MGIQVIEIYIRSTETGEVTKKKKITHNVTQGERLEVWVNDVMAYDYEWTNPWGDAEDEEYDVGF